MNSWEWSIRKAHDLLERTARKFMVAALRSPPPNMKNESEYLDYILKVLGQTIVCPLGIFPNFLEDISSGLRKSAIESENARNQGNVFFKIGKLDEASSLYTHSISYAEPGSKELALAYGNRSVILFQQKFYKECLEDIERALQNNYPPEKKDKLIVRQARAIELLNTQKTVPYHGQVPKIKNRNPDIPGASSCLKIENNKEFGRHLIAARDINPGQLLLVEKPYAQSVLLGLYDKYFLCSECLEWCYNLIPCEKCSGALYCSNACKKKAFVDYHRYECVILRHFGWDAIDWVATRMTLTGAKEYQTPDVNGAYKRMSTLYTYGDGPDFVKRNNNTDGFVAVAEVAKVFYVLKNYTDFFLEFDTEDKENVLKMLLLRDFRICEVNGFSVKRRHIEGPLTISLGRAVFYTFSLFNHACNENVGGSYYGSTVVVKAKKKIKQGEQCFINYGASPIVEPKIHRQRMLQENFHFLCKCQACVQNWPKKENLNNATKRLTNILEEIIKEVSTTNIQIDQSRRDILLQRTFSVAHELEDKAPCLAYKLTFFIFNRLLSDGNTNAVFPPMEGFQNYLANLIILSLFHNI